MYDLYRHLAANLALRLTPSDPGMMTFVIELAGEVDGHPVQLQRTCGQGAHITTTSPFRPHLDLGFGLGRAGGLSAISEWLGTKDIQTGDPEFDAAFTIRGDEPHRVVALLTPRVRSELAGLQIKDVKLTDAEFSSTLSVANEGVAELELAMREAVRIARTIEEARTSVPPSSALKAQLEAWVTFARAKGFLLESTPLGMQGRLGSAVVSARALRKSASEFLLELAVYSEKSLGASLLIQPRQGLLARLLAGNSIPSGDDAFDQAFEVTMAASARARELLDADVRRRLLELRRVGSVNANDYGLLVQADSASFDPSQLPLVIEEMSSVVETISRKAHPGAGYR